MRKQDLDQAKAQLRQCGSLLFERKLVWASSGNVSIRAGKDSFLVSRSGSCLGRLCDEDIVSCRISRESVGEEGVRPSIEAGLHRLVYRTCPEAQAVIHAQPFYSTLVGCSKIELRVDLLPETMAYVGRVGRVPYFHPGSKELAEAVGRQAGESRTMLLENHGVVCWGGSLDDALLETETLEFLCRMVVVSQAGGIQLRYLGEDAIMDFFQHIQRLHGAGA